MPFASKFARYATISLAVLFCSPLFASSKSMSASPDFPLQGVAQKVAAVESRGVEFGIYIQELGGAEILSYRPNTPYVLASNTKLFTTAAAILGLPKSFRWKTEARVDGNELWIVGGGDAAFHIIDGYSYPDKFLDELVRKLRERGQTSFQEMVVDARYFDDVYQHPHWPADQLRKRYSAPVSGLPYARGMVRMKIGKSSVYSAAYNPVTVAKTFLKHGLRKRGIQVANAREAHPNEAAPPAQNLVYVQESALSLREAVVKTNVDSDNFLAEHLLKTLGAELRGDGSFEGGTLAVQDVLADLGAPLTTFTQMDGSGLARKRNSGNRASPREVVTLLRMMGSHPEGAPFVDSLAVSGRSGTLKNRFSNGPLRASVVAKTGLIKGSVCLSGYLIRQKDRAALFAILANYSAADTYAIRESVRETQHAILRAVWQYLGQSQRPISASSALLGERFERIRETNRALR